MKREYEIWKLTCRSVIMSWRSSTRYESYATVDYADIESDIKGAVARMVEDYKKWLVEEKGCDEETADCEKGLYTFDWDYDDMRGEEFVEAAVFEVEGDDEDALREIADRAEEWYKEVISEVPCFGNDSFDLTDGSNTIISGDFKDADLGGMRRTR